MAGLQAIETPGLSTGGFGIFLIYQSALFVIPAKAGIFSEVRQRRDFYATAGSWVPNRKPFSSASTVMIEPSDASPRRMMRATAVSTFFWT